jgi:uncharacterized membrane protein YgdD (TMEM256/DUF423 family)
VTSPRTWLGIGAFLTVLGIAIAGSAPVLGTDGSGRTQAQQTAGGVVVVLGWALLAYAIHRFGREEQDG